MVIVQTEASVSRQIMTNGSMHSIHLHNDHFSNVRTGPDPGWLMTKAGEHWLAMLFVYFVLCDSFPVTAFWYCQFMVEKYLYFVPIPMSMLMLPSQTSLSLIFCSFSSQAQDQLAEPFAPAQTFVYVFALIHLSFHKKWNTYSFAHRKDFPTLLF